MENREISELLSGAIKETEEKTREGVIKQQKLKIALREIDIEQGDNFGKENDLEL